MWFVKHPSTIWCIHEGWLRDLHVFPACFYHHVRICCPKPFRFQARTLLKSVITSNPKHGPGRGAILWIILLIAEIPNNHPGMSKTLYNVEYLPYQLVHHQQYVWLLLVHIFEISWFMMVTTMLATSWRGGGMRHVFQLISYKLNEQKWHIWYIIIYIYVYLYYIFIQYSTVCLLLALSVCGSRYYLMIQSWY